MSKQKRKGIQVMLAIAAFIMLSPVIAFAAGQTQKYIPAMYATFWALVPSVVAIALALITKEVYSSLFVGILVGGLFYSGFQFEGTVMHIYQNGFIQVLSDSDNMGILLFLVLLGTMVALMNKAGGSAAFGRWAGEHIKTRVGAQLAAIALGVLIFIDDYFNCLTVGSVMRPVTDKHKISRAKFAYLIDATAAPVCIIAPISSWAAAVSGFVEGEDGFSLFVRAIPFNYYALLTLVMMVGMVILKIEFGPMAIYERNAMKGDLFSSTARPYTGEPENDDEKKGKVVDMLLPIICLIVCCIIGMIYTGGFFAGTDLVTAFSNCDASVGLALGSFFGLLITILLYLVRRVLSFKECMECLSDGFKAMVPAILILTFAWTLKSMTDSLGAAQYVAGVMENVAGELVIFLPAIIFIVGCFLAFATGTSWGTFGILIPIVVAVFKDTNAELMIMSISACMAGAVCGDHCSPISDTTIMASAGAQCEHVSHVSTQLPYAMVVAAISFVSYVVAAVVLKITGSYALTAVISLAFALAVTVAVMMIIKYAIRGKSVEES